jgi:putative transposase
VRRGYDGGKNVRGRKRYLLVDTEALILKAKYTAQRSSTETGSSYCWSQDEPEALNLKHLWLDAGYEGRGKRWRMAEVCSRGAP